VKVATTKAQRKLFFNLRSAKKRLGWFTREEVESVAADLGVKPSTVLEMEARLSNQDLAFDGYDDDDDDAPSAPSTYLPDTRMEPLKMLELEDTEADDKKRLYAAIQSLDERSKVILRERWLNEKKQTLHELAQQFSVSAERIRQIEKNAMKKLRLQLEV
jgi:RNA polymerase sigma-32 factor